MDQFTDQQLIAAVPKIKLRKIYWDDLQEGDSVTLEVNPTEKLGLLYMLLTGNHDHIYYIKGKSFVPSALIMPFISAVGGCYLGGENIFLVKKGEAYFYSPITLDTNTLFIKGEVAKKYSKKVKGKERYYADLEQIVYVKEGEDLVKVAETKALAGILKKVRPLNEQKSELIPRIQFSLPEDLSQLDYQSLRQELYPSHKPKSFEVIQEGDVVEISIQVTHKMILLFALISGDYNPLHTDPEFAKDLKAFEGKNIAHGALISAWFSGTGVLELLGAGFRLIKKDEAVFKRAIKVNDEILIRLKIKRKFFEVVDGIKKFYVDVEEYCFLKQESTKYTEAVTSGSRYQLYY